MEKLILSKLNLDPGYVVSAINYDQNLDSFFIDIDYQLKASPCPLCQSSSKIYDRISREWRHIDYQYSKVYITFKNPRIKCEEHGVKLTDVNWAKPKHRFTIELEDLVCRQAENKSFLQIAKELGEHDTRIRRVVQRSKDEKNN
ncbi:helix-turn-helix domain-containing protein [Mollicutes bacterium LVI A0039]|nr:helix-turn-helix domain-containing protein [Mollicutes bacterium LVI A0039]